MDEAVSRRTLLRWSVIAGAGAVLAAPASRAAAAQAGSPATRTVADEAGTNTTAAAPYLLWCSDAVSPGSVFAVEGERLADAALRLAVSPATGAPRPVPPANATYLDFLAQDSAGHFLSAVLPATLAPGVYEMWAGTGAGWSRSLLLNGPRPLYTSEYEAWAGQEITVVGRNFDPAEHGRSGAPAVRLRHDRQTVAARVVAYTPFAITFRVPAAAVGRTYLVEVSTDQRTWVAAPADDALTILAVGRDPLGLGVGWAGTFSWQRTFDVRRFGVRADAGSDATAGVQAAVDAAKQAGGGIVTFPSGRFEIGTINLPADVVIRGAGPHETTLVSTAVGNALINTAGDGNTRGHHGVADLRIEMKDQAVRPDTVIRLAEPWAQNGNTTNMSVRTASQVFVHRVHLSYSLEGPTVTSGQRAIGVGAIARERVLVSECDFVGYHAQPYINYITNYYTVRGNRFEFSTGNIVGNGSRVFYVENEVVAHRDYGTAAGAYDLHGFFARDRAYMYRNTATGLGSLVPGSTGGGTANDGESFAVETPNAAFNFGPVVSATPDSITVTPVVSLVDPLLYFGRLCVLITDGAGLGQLRQVAGIDGATNTIAVAQEWAVTPDASSAFTLFLPLDGVTIHANTATDCTKGMWLYGNSYDSVMADNTSLDSEGFFIQTVRGTNRFIPGYFVRVARNKVTGVSPKSQHGGISYNTGRFDRAGAYFGTMAYAIEFRDNHIVGDPTAIPISGSTESPPYSGIAAMAATYSTIYDGDPTGTDGKSILVSGNSLENLQTGMTVTHSNTGVVVADNTYASTVATDYTNTGSLATLQHGNHRSGQAADDPKLTVNARSQSWSGHSYVAVYALNTDTVALDIRLSTRYGHEDFTAVPPGQAVYKAFDTGAVHSPADLATITAVKSAADGAHYTVLNAPYAAN